MPIRLALSLHAPENDLRSQIMPVNERYDLQEVLAACEAFYERKRRMVFIEYVMLAGVNDSYAHAVKLAQILDPKIYKLNLIPYNPTDSIYDGSSRNAIETFRAALEKHGLSATVRLTRGRDIDAACGSWRLRISPARSRQSRAEQGERVSRVQRHRLRRRTVLEQREGHRADPMLVPEPERVAAAEQAGRDEVDRGEHRGRDPRTARQCGGAGARDGEGRRDERTGHDEAEHVVLEGHVEVREPRAAVISIAAATSAPRTSP